MNKIKKFFVFVLLLCAITCFASCGWKKYSTNLQVGEYVIEKFEENPFFNENTILKLTDLKPENAENHGYVTADGKEIYFIFENYDPDIKSITCNNIANKSFSFDATTADNRNLNFSIYSYDWSDVVYVNGYDITFKIVK